MSRALGNDPLKQSLFKKTDAPVSPAEGDEEQRKIPSPAEIAASAEEATSPTVAATPVPEEYRDPYPTPPAPIRVQDVHDDIIDALPDEIEVIGFRLGKREFGIDIRCVQRVIPMVEVTSVPQPLSFLEGVIDLMGAIVPVISLRRLLGMQPLPHTLRSHIIIAEHGERTVGLIVDAVSDLIQISKEVVDPPTNITPLRHFLTGIARLHARILFMLRIDRIMDIEREAEANAGISFEAGMPLDEFEEKSEAEDGLSEHEREILRRRALMLSQRVEHEDMVTRQLLTFSLANEWYGVDTPNVRTIVASPDIISVPCAPPHIRGVMNLRGEILTVVDLKRFFGLDASPYSGQNRVIVALQGDWQIGFYVDSVFDVIDLPTSSIELPLATIEKVRADFIEGEARLEDRLLGILKLETTMNPRLSKGLN
ncbi:MAG: chemotaxis protein CheW [Planctomycetota bacterium]|nr:chemotaxis protein CheW [Planctomycetota bacterium]